MRGMAHAFNGFGGGFGLTPMVKRLLVANVVVFLAMLVIGQDFVFEWFAFQPTRIVLRPWGPFTYMFLHGSLMHVAVNMLVLFFFGPPLEARWGEREFLKFYVICGLGGVALSYLFLPAWVVGASAAVYGVMLAFAMNWPNVPIYVWGIFPVQAKYLVGFLFVVSLLSAVQGSSDGVAHFAHLGGLAAGFFYLKADWRPKQQVERLKKAVGPSRRMAIVPRDEDDGTPSPRRRRGRRSEEEVQLLDRVDAVLDKISAEGMSALTAEERQLLDEMSRRTRSN